MNNARFTQILLFIFLPIGCLFLPAYGDSYESRLMFESFFTVNILPIYSWLPAFVLIFLGLFDLHTYIHGQIILSRRITNSLIIGCLLYQVIDVFIWIFQFFEAPQIGVVSVFFLLLYRLFIRPQVTN